MNPTGAWETVLYPTLALVPAPTTPAFGVVGNRGLFTPGNVVYNVAPISAPATCTGVTVGISAEYVVERVIACDVAVVITGQPVGFAGVVTRRYTTLGVPIINNFSTTAAVSFNAEVWDIANAMGPSATMHITVSFVMDHVYYPC